MSTPLPRFQPAGESALLVTFSAQVDLAVNQQVHGLASAARQALARRPLPGIGEMVPGYSTLLFHYDPALLDYDTVEAFARAACAREATMRQNPADAQAAERESRLIEVPVVYGGDAGPDLAFVAHHNGLSEAEVVRIHAGRSYPVFMIGFTPGFPYLGGMDPSIAAPRLSTPRSRVPGGSVGIAGEQTGIYPLESPGGWRIIGRTALALFDPQREPPSLIAPGDTVRFLPVHG